MVIRRWLALLAVPAATLALTTPAMASASRTAAAAGTEIIVAETAFGPTLAVGSGPFKNFTLYFISSDHGRSFGCTTGATKTPVGPITCTGPSNDKNAEWPAITSAARPVAGPGVSQRLLSRVYRKGVGYQVTYAGHPLYLFDQQPGAVTGQGWFERALRALRSRSAAPDASRPTCHHHAARRQPGATAASCSMAHSSAWRKVASSASSLRRPPLPRCLPSAQPWHPRPFAARTRPALPLPHRPRRPWPATRPRRLAASPASHTATGHPTGPRRHQQRGPPGAARPRRRPATASAPSSVNGPGNTDTARNTRRSRPSSSR